MAQNFANKRLGWALAVAFHVFAASLAQAVPPGDTLVPATTKAFVSVANVPKFLENWNKTEFGRLLEDNQMQAFRDDLERQLEAQGMGLRDSVGISVEDLDGLASGELSVAVFPTPAGKAGVVVIADVTGTAQFAQKTLEKAGAYFVREGGVRSEQQAAGGPLSVFDIPANEKNKKKLPARQAAYFLSQNVVGMANSAAVAGEVLKRLNGQGGPNLAGVAAYQAVLKRAADGNAFPPDVRWFVEPFGLLDLIRASQPRAPQAGPDPLKIARDVGFDAIKGAGGLVSLAAGPFNAVHRTTIFAPPPYQKSMRMLVFTNGGEFAPPAWVPKEVATYTSFQWDLANAFDNFGPLFDEIFGEGEEGVWTDVLESIKTDPNGPQLDLRTDLVAHLGKRITAITDVQLPVTPTSQRRLIAIEATDEKALAVAIDKSMQNDKDVKQREFKGNKVYEILPEDQPVEGAAGEAKPADEAKPAANRTGQRIRRAAGNQGENEAQERLLPNSAVCVANGNLFLSTHLDFLERILSAPNAPHPLAGDAGFQTIERQMTPLGAKTTCMQAFSRDSDKWFLPFELFKQGKLPESDMPLAQVINALYGEPEDGQVRKQQFDGSKLPDYAVVRKYLGIGGDYVTSEHDGWFIVGFSLPPAKAEQAADAR